MPLMFPSKDELDELFGFVSDEDRQRWAERPQQGPGGSKQPMFSDMGRSLERAAHMRHQREQFSEAQASSDRRPKRRVTETVTEHTTIDDDYVR